MSCNHPVEQVHVSTLGWYCHLCGYSEPISQISVTEMKEVKEWIRKINYE